MGEPTTIQRPAAARGTAQPARLGNPGLSLHPPSNRGEEKLGRPTPHVNRLTVEQANEAAAKQRRDKARRARAERWERRHELRSFTTLPSVRRCGVAPIPTRTADGMETDSPVSLRVRHNEDGTRTANLGGLQHCASVWACPTCSATVATQRAEELRGLFTWARKQGYSASMATFTIRHHAGHRLKQQWDAVAQGWAAATGGKAWTKQKKRYGLVGSVKVVETTHREAFGWHVHLHVLLIWNRPEDEEVRKSARTLTEKMHARWASKLEALGFESWRDSGGLDVRMAKLSAADNTLSDYFTKLAHEVTGGYAKQAKGKGRSPFQVLADILDADGDDPERLVRDFELWGEWEQGSKGRKQMAWSKGLREAAALGAEKSDQLVIDESGDLVPTTPDLPEDEVINLTPSTWFKLAYDPWGCIALLDAAEDGGIAAACAWLDAHGYRWYWPPPEEEKSLPKASPAVIEQVAAPRPDVEQLLLVS